MSSVSKSTCLSPKKKSSLNSPDAEGATQSASKFSSGKKRKVDGGGPARVEAEETTLRVKLLTEHATAPKRGSAHAAGYDISSARDCVIPSGGRLLVETDVAVALPEGTYGRVAPRSGLALKSGIDVGAGVIDVDYRGPLGVLLFNHSDKDFEVKCGDRVAQLVIEVIRTPEVEIVETLEETLRGDGGFGSTGVGTDVTNTVETK